jgi:hypothetical protein
LVLGRPSGGIVFLGVYPKPMLERMEPSVDALIAHVEANVDGFEEPVTQAGASLGARWRTATVTATTSGGRDDARPGATGGDARGHLVVAGPRCCSSWVVPCSC